MLIKNKHEPLTTKSKEKQKVSHIPEHKKTKKNPTLHKMQSSASVRVLKTTSSLKPQKNQIHPQNENQNLINFPQKGSAEMQKCWHIIQQQTEERQPTYRNLRKSASTGGIKIHKGTRRSLSPALNKQKSDTLRIKYSSKQTSRSEKQKKPKHSNNAKNKSSEKLKSTIDMKYREDHPEKKSKNRSVRTTRHQSQHLKTQQSSKMPSVSKEMDGQKARKKTYKNNKGKDGIKPSHSKSKLKPSKIGDKIKNSIVFSDVSFQEASPIYSGLATKNNFSLQLTSKDNKDLPRQIEASIVIQKHFRGYLTRKYIEQLKYMVCCIIKIQKVWRGFNCRRKVKKQTHLNKKNLSIENSLITIKDFSEEPKQQRLKDKQFKFVFEQLSSQKKDGKSPFKGFSSHKKSGTEKYVDILESLLQEEGLQEKFKDKIRVSLGINSEEREEVKEQQKEEYVKKKINSQIVSQKSFNSPRDIRSPKNSIAMNSPSSWAKNRSFECSVQICNSPAADKIVKRMVSPNKIKSPCSSAKKKSEKKCEQKQQRREGWEIKPFETSFEFLEEFEMKIIDFLKENPEELEMFLQRCKNCQFFRTKLVLAEWDKFSEEPYFDSQLVPKFAISQEFLLPIIFPSPVKNQILRQPQMQIYLQENNYFDELWRDNEIQRTSYEGMIRCIFDGLTHAIYEQYLEETLFKKTKSRSCILRGYPLFTNILMNSLTRVQTWTEYHCGMEIPVPPTHQNYGAYKDKKNEQEQLAIKSQMGAITENSFSSWMLWLEVMVGEMIFQQLAEEIQRQQPFNLFF